MNRLRSRCLRTRARRLAVLAALLFGAGAVWGQKPTLRIFINKPSLATFHPGLEYEKSNACSISTTGVYRKYEWAKMLGGIEWRPWKPFVARFGYNPGRGDTPVAERFALGTSIRLGNNELQYAWTPFNRSERMHYLSLAWRF